MGLLTVTFLASLVSKMCMLTLNSWPILNTSGDTTKILKWIVVYYAQWIFFFLTSVSLYLIILMLQRVFYCELFCINWMFLLWICICPHTRGLMLSASRESIKIFSFKSCTWRKISELLKPAIHGMVHKIRYWRTQHVVQQN